MTPATAGREWPVLRWRCPCGFGISVVGPEPVAMLTLAAAQRRHAGHGASSEVERVVIVETGESEEVDCEQAESDRE